MNKIVNFVISFIFPRTCSLCGKTFHYDYEYNICNNCLKKLPELEQVLICKKCSLPLSSLQKDCPDCKNNKKVYFNVLKSPYIYSGSIKMLIKELKYFQKAFLAKDLSLLLADFIFKQNIDKETDIIIAVPMFKIKKLLRGYNQAALLAEGVSNIIKKPVLQNVLLRKKHTEAQFKLSKLQRHKNLENMFYINEKYSGIIKNKNVLLVDDVATTCATVNQCSKILKEKGVGKIVAVTLARAK